MTRKTKCKLLFFSTCNARRDLSRNPYAAMCFYDGICNFSHTYFSRITTDSDISPSLEKSVLSVGWLTIRTDETSCKEVVEKRIILPLKWELVQISPRVFNNLVFLMLHMYITNIFCTLLFDWECYKVSNINKFSTKVCIYRCINYLSIVSSYEVQNIKIFDFQIYTTWKITFKEQVIFQVASEISIDFENIFRM